MFKLFTSNTITTKIIIFTTQYIFFIILRSFRITLGSTLQRSSKIPRNRLKVYHSKVSNAIYLKTTTSYARAKTDINLPGSTVATSARLEATVSGSERGVVDTASAAGAKPGKAVVLHPVSNKPEAKQRTSPAYRPPGRTARYQSLFA